MSERYNHLGGAILSSRHYRLHRLGIRGFNPTLTLRHVILLPYSNSKSLAHFLYSSREMIRIGRMVDIGVQAWSLAIYFIYAHNGYAVLEQEESMKIGVPVCMNLWDSPTYMIAYIERNRLFLQTFAYRNAIEPYKDCKVAFQSVEGREHRFLVAIAHIGQGLRVLHRGDDSLSVMPFCDFSERPGDCLKHRTVIEMRRDRRRSES